MLFWQLFLYCLLFTAMVKLAVGNSAVNGLFFYPQAVQERAFALGLSDRETVRRRFRRFMAAFYLVMPAALLGIVGAGTASGTSGALTGRASFSWRS